MYKKNLATWNKKKQAFTVEKINILMRANAKIKLTINYAYEHLKIGEEIMKARKKFNIPDDFFERYQVEQSSNYIADLLVNTIIKWKKEIIKTDNAKINKKLGDYINKNNNLDTLNPKYINQRLWSFIIWAKLYGIPKKILLDCISNLFDYYFPTIDDNLQIKVHPMTTEEEIKFIWPDVTEKQKKIIKNIDKRGKFEYSNHDRDKIAYELRKNNQMPYKEIAGELKKQGLGSYIYIDIPKFIKKYKEFIGEIS